MPSQGPLSATIAGTAPGGDGPWSDTGNIFAADNVAATATAGGGIFGGTHWLIGRGFGFTIPAGSTITGVLVEYRVRTSSTNNAQISGAYIAERIPSPVSYNVLGSSDTSQTIFSTTYTYLSRGGPASLWGTTGELTPALVNSDAFSVGMWFQRVSSPNQTISVDHVRVTVFYTDPNTAPAITATPTVFYGSRTRLGPNNSPAVVSFTATDADGDPLTYSIRTAAGGGGTEVGSGNATSGVPVNHNIAHNAPGLSGNGSQTLYLVVSDGTDSDEESFTLLQDNAAPTVGTIIHAPDPVTGGG